MAAGKGPAAGRTTQPPATAQIMATSAGWSPGMEQGASIIGDGCETGAATATAGARDNTAASKRARKAGQGPRLRFVLIRRSRLIAPVYAREGRNDTVRGRWSRPGQAGGDAPGP